MRLPSIEQLGYSSLSRSYRRTRQRRGCRRYLYRPSKDQSRSRRCAGAANPRHSARPDAGGTDAASRRHLAIAGTHGKTTTTNLTASILGAAGLDPTFVIGGKLNAAGTNARLGKGEYIVAEADSPMRPSNIWTPDYVHRHLSTKTTMDTYGHSVENCIGRLSILSTVCRSTVKHFVYRQRTRPRDFTKVRQAIRHLRLGRCRRYLRDRHRKRRRANEVTVHVQMKGHEQAPLKSC